MPDPDPPYEVGFGRPPRQHQFKPGQSGNPRGRPKGARGLKTDLKAELESRMTIRINNESVSETRQRLLLRALSSRAAAGDVRAAAILIPIIIQVLGVEDRGGARRALSPLDQSILDDMLKSVSVEKSPTEAAPESARNLGRPVAKPDTSEEEDQ